MTTFVFVRHGETLATKKGIFSGGKTDSPLTEEGILGTRLFVHKLFNSSEEHFDACITSELQRTKAFGFFFKEFFGGPVFADPRFNEKDAGVFEGCESEDFHSIGGEEAYKDRWVKGLPLGESHYQVAARVVEAMLCWEQFFPNQRILVGSHTDVIRSLSWIQEEIDKGEVQGYVFSNIWPTVRSNDGHPTDEKLTIPIPYFHTLEVRSTHYQYNHIT